MLSVAADADVVVWGGMWIEHFYIHKALLIPTPPETIHS